MNETLGKIHFFGSFVCMNVIFMPMFLVGLAGVSRRLFDGGASYAFAQPVLHLNVVPPGARGSSRSSRFPSSSISSGASGRERRPADNPWQATTIEWAAPSPPRTAISRGPEAYRGPYEYSVPGAAKDFSPQYEA
jgi:cytochrome c oxidase subunit 1